MLLKLKDLAIQWFRNLKDKGAFHIIVGSVLTKVVGLVGSILVVRLISKPEYGIYGYYDNLNSYLLIFLGFGLSTGLLRYLVIADDECKRDCFRFALTRGSAWNVLILLAGTALMLLYPHRAAFAPYKLVGMILVFSLPFTFFQYTGLDALRALFDNKGYAWASFLAALLLIAFRVLGAKLGSVYTLTGARLISEALVGLGCVFFAYRHLAKMKGEQRKIPPTLQKELTRYSWQVMLTDGLWTMFMLNDVLILGQFGGSETMVADYQVAYVIPSNLSIFTISISIFVGPFFTKHEHDGDFLWVRKNFLRVLLANVGLMAAEALVCFVLARPLIVFLYTEEYLSSVPIMRVLLLASFLNYGVRATVASILSSIGRQKVNLIVAGIGIVVQITLDILLIGQLGAIGLALASTLVHLVMGTILLVYFIRYLNRSIAQAKAGCE